MSTHAAANCKACTRTSARTTSCTAWTSTCREGEVTMLLGRNGAGKTTTLRTIMGLWQAIAGRRALQAASRSTGCATPEIANRGIAYVPESMGIFTDLTVQGEHACSPRARARHAGELDTQRLEWIFGLFPALKKFWLYPAGKLSGGQKQMLAVARAIVEPRALLLIDEPSKGLAPAIINNLIDAFSELKRQRHDDPAGRAELPHGASARRHGGGDGQRRGRAHRLDGASWPTTRRCSSACWACRWRCINEHPKRSPRRSRRDWSPSLPAPARSRRRVRLEAAGAAGRARARRAAADRLAVDLGHAHGRRPGDGHDHLHHRLGPDAGVRPDGRAELRPRRVHRARRLRRHQRDGRHGRLDAASVAAGATWWRCSPRCWSRWWWPARSAWPSSA